jgi:2-polyprenyl-3-methyl-5-hydroxy-6-metoxy-1,4-benzoquinol methylase
MNKADQYFSDFAEAYLEECFNPANLYLFKRTHRLPRISKVLGIIKGIHPDSLLDIGSGRGALLWPLLEDFPELQVTAVDLEIDIIAAVAKRIENLVALKMDASNLIFSNFNFDVVTILEVLEHVIDPVKVARECMRTAKRFVVATVPSKKDDNPEHLRLFTKQSLTDLFLDAGAQSVKIKEVPNHFIVVAKK